MHTKKEGKIKKILKWIFPYIILTVIIAGTLAIIYKDANILYPLKNTGGDEMGVYYIVKTIQKYGILLENPDVGGVVGSNMYDYFYSENLVFLLVKIIGIFFDNTYLVTNILYFSFYVLAGWTAYYAAGRVLKTKYTPYLVGVLYAFIPFTQLRYSHMWLCGHFMLPLVCLTALEIAKGELFWDESERRRPLEFWRGIITAVLVSGTGLYYAFFACMAYGFAFVINWINNEKKTIRRIGTPLAFIAASVVGVVLNIFPNILYIVKNGINLNSQTFIRLLGDCETFGLKLIQLLLPRADHRISFLAEVAEKYNENFPLVTENATASLGIVGTVGLVVSLLWLFHKKRAQKEESLLILIFLLFGTVGGLSSALAVVIYLPIRCYNRASLIIGFLSLLVLAECLESLYDRLSDRKNVQRIVTLVVILLIPIGIYDQTVDYEGQEEIISEIDDDQKFISQIEDCLDTGDLVFELPVVSWPSDGYYNMFKGYLGSDELRWSYGAVEGREEAQWKEKTGEEKAENLIKEIKRSGYRGLYLDKSIYSQIYGEEAAVKREDEFDKLLGKPDVVNEDNTIVYWNIGE